MKSIVCEMCGSHDFVKQDGLFVCQYCGTKYTPEEAKKMFVEGTVTISNQGTLENYLKLSSTALDSGNALESYNYAMKALEIDFECIDAWAYKILSLLAQSTKKDDKITEISEAIIKFFEHENIESVRVESLIDNIFDYLIDRENFAIDSYCDTSIVIKYYNELKMSAQWLQADRILKEEDGDICIDRDRYISMLLTLIFDIDYENLYQYPNLVDKLKMIITNGYQVNKSLKDRLAIYYCSIPKDYAEQKAELFENLRTIYENSNSKVEEIKIDEKNKRIEDYWNNHQIEKQSLMNENDSLKKEKDFLLKRINSIENDETLIELTEETEKLLKDKKNMGLFKSKEKKKISEIIEANKIKISSITDEIKIKTKEDYLRLDIINRRLNEINLELTMDRQ